MNKTKLSFHELARIFLHTATLGISFCFCFVFFSQTCTFCNNFCISCDSSFYITPELSFDVIMSYEFGQSLLSYTIKQRRVTQKHGFV